MHTEATILQTAKAFPSSREHKITNLWEEEANALKCFLCAFILIKFRRKKCLWVWKNVRGFVSKKLLFIIVKNIFSDKKNSLKKVLSFAILQWSD
jgi:hypothetical protein